jgi:enediyne biosynthesis protein E4
MSANINELPCQKKKVILCSNLTDTTALNLVNKQSTTKNTVKNIGLLENYFTEELQIKTLLTPLSKHIPPPSLLPCFLCLLAILLTFGCDQNPDLSGPKDTKVHQELFTDKTGHIGISFVHQSGDPNDYFMPRSLGSGTALFDFNLDGLLDIYCLQNAGPGSGINNQLFKQNTDGTFDNISKGSGLDVDGHSMGVAVGDISNDGYPDVLITGYQSTRLFLNLEGRGFQEITEASGIDNPGWSSSASFLDFDRDGWLDIAIANYIEYAPSVECSGKDGKREFCGPDGFPSATPKLYRNTGKDFTFEDVTVPSGFARHPGPGLGVVCQDFNGDHWVDIFFADDAKPNRLFINQQNGTFLEEGLKRGLALDAMGHTKANMGVAVGDADNDEMIDIFVTHLVTERHTLWRQEPPGIFSDRTASFGLTQSQWRGTGFGTVMADFDNDTDMDIAYVNGDIRATQIEQVNPKSAPNQFWFQYAQRNQIFLNNGDGKLEDASELNPAFCENLNVGRGLAVGDLNNDGQLDLVVSSIDSPVRILFGKTHGDKNWILIRATDPERGNRVDYGTEVTVIAGQNRWRKWLNPGGSYLCSNDPRLHFGLSEYPDYDSIEVLWSDGTTEKFAGGKASKIINLQKGSGEQSLGVGPNY